MALDVGDRRIGVAVSDPLRLFARPLLTHERGAVAADAAFVAGLAVEWAVERVVVGHPLLPSGQRGEQALAVEAFVDRLGPTLTVPVVLWDESYTTLAALERRAQRGKSGARERVGGGGDRGLDAEAAAVILEEWLREQGLALEDGGDAG